MVILTLTEKEAKIVSKACEFYSRIRMGQFKEIIYNCLDIKADHYSYRRECAERLLLQARVYTHPGLDATFGHSYGIGQFEDADMAYDVHQAIRYAMGGKEPFSYNTLPKCEIKFENDTQKG